ncbi:alpha-sarcoglycan [Protopterus annectens]|uniref:alpha-sarcoglycan n=1 Tax=Protopterus annectens TaxID=7888 RepID=UPI001CFBE5A8|nr:alpha-sarcoglycan [Protopterus annectens]
MRDITVWNCWLASFLAFLSVCQGDQDIEVNVGILHVYKLDIQDFHREFQALQNKNEFSTDDPMTFHPKLQNFPDLPRWLRFIQRTPYQSAFLYGNPMPEDAGQMTIEVTALNRRAYETVRQRIIFNIQPDTAPALPYQVEFFLKNQDVEEVLPTAVQEKFKNAIESLWPSANLKIVNITSALDRGGRVPLPLPGLKEGVYILVGSSVPFSKCLEEVMSEENQRRCKLQSSLNSCNYTISSQFLVDWCKLRQPDKPLPTVPAPTPGDGILKDGGEYNPPAESLKSRDFYTDHLVTMLVPILLALLLLIILAYIMFCRREGLEKRDERTPDLQLFHHHTIQDNYSELRNMADNREVPRPLSTLPMFNLRTGDRMPPLQQPFSTDSSRVPLVMAEQQA